MFRCRLQRQPHIYLLAILPHRPTLVARPRPLAERVFRSPRKSTSFRIDDFRHNSCVIKRQSEVFEASRADSPHIGPINRTFLALKFREDDSLAAQPERSTTPANNFFSILKNLSESDDLSCVLEILASQWVVFVFVCGINRNGGRDDLLFGKIKTCVL